MQIQPFNELLPPQENMKVYQRQLSTWKYCGRVIKVKDAVCEIKTRAGKKNAFLWRFPKSNGGLTCNKSFGTAIN